MGKPAVFDVIEDGPERLVLRDVGSAEHFTVTNDAERVVETLAVHLRGRRLLYYDSNGDLAEIRIVDGRFAGFEPL